MGSISDMKKELIVYLKAVLKHLGTDIKDTECDEPKQVKSRPVYRANPVQGFLCALYKVECQNVHVKF